MGRKQAMCYFRTLTGQALDHVLCGGEADLTMGADLSAQGRWERDRRLLCRVLDGVHAECRCEASEDLTTPGVIV